jgi:hypothetical protein
MSGNKGFSILWYWGVMVLVLKQMQSLASWNVTMHYCNNQVQSLKAQLN